MKLNKTKVHFILRQYRKHASTKEISRDVKVSQRRVQQIVKQYKETGLEPVLGEKVGRPFKPYDEQEAKIVREAHTRYRFGARMLEPVIRKQYKICISHNRIHMYLKARKMKISRNAGSGFAMSESIAFPRAISTGMNGMGPISRSA